jgi:hypothetical protein
MYDNTLQANLAPNMMMSPPMMNPGFAPQMGFGGQVQVAFFNYGELNGFQKLEHDYGLLLKERSNFYPGCCKNVYSSVAHVYPLAEDGRNKKASKFLKSTTPKGADEGCLPAACRPFKMFINHRNYNDLTKDDLPFLAIQRECSPCFCFAPDLELKNVENGQDQLLGKLSFPSCTCGPSMNIADSNGNPKFLIEQSCGECLSSMLCCGDLVLDIKDNGGQVVGSLGKHVKPRNFGGSCCGKACLVESYTYMKFPPQAQGVDRAMLTAAGIWANQSIAFMGRPTKYTRSG